MDLDGRKQRTMGHLGTIEGLWDEGRSIYDEFPDGTRAGVELD